MSDPPEPIAGQAPAQRVMQLREAGFPDAAFDFAQQALDKGGWEIGVLIEFGEAALAVAKPHLALPLFIRNLRVIAGNAWAIAIYQRVLEMSARIIANLAQENGEALVEMAGQERDATIGPLRHHFYSCLANGLPIDARLRRQFRESRPDDVPGMAMEPARFTNRPEAAKAAAPATPSTETWRTAPAAELWFEEPRVVWTPRIGEPRVCDDGTPKFWEVRNALVYMLPGVFGLVQFADGSFYDPPNIGAVHMRSAKCMRGFGRRRYFFPEGVPPEHRVEKHLPGLSAVPFRLAGTYYFHCLTETIKHAHYLSDAFPEARILAPAAHDYFDRMSRGVFDEAISSAVDDERLIHLDHGVYRADRLLIPREWSYGGLDFADEIVSRLAPGALGGSKSGRILLITRPASQGRSVVNEPELVEGLARRFSEFSALALDDMSFGQQVAAFANARVVIGPHGGGLTNIMFCAPGTVVIEFFFEQSGIMYRDVSAQRRLRYIGYIHGRDGARNADGERYEINLAELCRLLDSVLEDSPNDTTP